MHYYSHNIGDYRKDTHHLSLLEHGVYRQLLDTYYLSEKPLTLDHAILMRTHCARNADDMQAVESVLKDFFVRTEEGYIHKRCDVEIEAFHSKSVSARESAKARWDRVRAEKEAEAMRSHSEGNANHKPITNNQEPEDQKPLASGKKKAKTDKPAFELPEWIDQGAWDGFIEMRKAIKKPLTDSGKKLAVDKLQKLGREGHSPKEVLNQSTLSSWQGLFAIKEEFRNGQNANTSGPVSAVGRVAAKAAERERARQGAAPQYYEQGDFIEGEFAPG